MRRTAWRLLAAASLIAVAGAATRPHYGGTLRVQTRERTAPRDLVFDPLVTFNDSAQPQACSGYRLEARRGFQALGVSASAAREVSRRDFADGRGRGGGARRAGGDGAGRYRGHPLR